MENDVLLGRSADWWNSAMLVSLGIAAVVAVLVAAATTGAVVAAKREATAAKAELGRYRATVAGQVADAKKEGIKAGKEAGDANVRAAEADTNAAETRERAAEAELALAQYRAGSSLTMEQKQRMEDVLRLASKGPVIIKPNLLSPEPTRYANELSEVFNRVGFVGVGDKHLSIISTNLPGLFVVVRDRDQLPPQFAPIEKALQAANIPFSAHAEAYVPDVNTVVILVGERP